MSILSEKIEGYMINVDLNSSNIKSACYNTLLDELSVTFKNNVTYKYFDVPWEIFTKFRMSPSQGKFLGENISKIYAFKKIETVIEGDINK
jgi:hypothetical protein